MSVMDKFGTDDVFEPGPNKVFVFGSNTRGIHGAGAALTAYQEYGAMFGIGEGMINCSYALPTKDESLRTLPISEVQKSVDRFIVIAEVHPELEFFVTRVGCGLAGYDDREIAPLFKKAPNNCKLPPGWREFASKENKQESK